MGFYRIFNIIYKLFSKRGLKAFIISLLILAIIFIFSGKVFAYEIGDIATPVTSNQGTAQIDIQNGWHILPSTASNNNVITVGNGVYNLACYGQFDFNYRL